MKLYVRIQKPVLPKLKWVSKLKDICTKQIENVLNNQIERTMSIEQFTDMVVSRAQNYVMLFNEE